MPESYFYFVYWLITIPIVSVAVKALALWVLGWERSPAKSALLMLGANVLVLACIYYPFQYLLGPLVAVPLLFGLIVSDGLILWLRGHEIYDNDYIWLGSIIVNVAALVAVAVDAGIFIIQIRRL